MKYLLIPLLFLGCANKNVEKIVIKKCEYPTLKIYKSKELELHIKRKNNNICIKEWSVCFKEKDFKELYKTLNERKIIIERYTKEIKEYNNFAKEQNEK